MQIKQLYIIERIFVYLINLIYLPITLLYLIFYYLLQLFDYLMNLRDTFITYISHKLFLCCNERDNIKNEYVYNKMSIKALYQLLKENNKI